MKTDYYVLLGVEQTCAQEDIKRAYRKLALSNHPDKASLNGLTDAEATENFQALQEAYSVLSDPRQRSWYDSHWEQILDDGAKENQDPLSNLSKYSSCRCYKGFGDDERGFYSVYRELFRQVQQHECERGSDVDSDGALSGAPDFGNSRSPWETVSAFYKHWTDFSSRRSFSHADKWNPNTADNRQLRRRIEAENKKAKNAARKAFNEKIQELVRFARDVDPRVREHRQGQAQAEARKKAEKEALQKQDVEDKKLQAEHRKRKLAPVATLCR